MVVVVKYTIHPFGLSCKLCCDTRRHVLLNDSTAGTLFGEPLKN